MNERYEQYKARIEEGLKAYFGDRRGFPFDGLLDAMDYSLMAGGKRIRPVLVLEFCRAAGGDPASALPVACAVEMLHTYSLIHDDLPCMDNDELRRGRPTNHVVYGECTATLAGDALQAEAFGTILRAPLPAETRASCAEMLADAAGVDGICGGQYLDMLGEGKSLTEDELTEIHSRKTGSMIVAACRMGAAVGGADMEQLDAAARYGAALGLAFQIRDDMLDEIATEAELGKPIGSDRAEGKTTFMTLYGRARCQDMVERLTEAAKTAACTFPDPEFLAALADKMACRIK
jgi:geranylgeranyl diphosphate synthase type II